MHTRRAPFGSWPSPVSASLLASAGVTFAEVRTDGETVYWNETRPLEGGRGVIVARGTDGMVRDVLPDGYSARTRVHEYGGGAFHVEDGCVVFVNDEDQRLYRLVEGEDPEPITPAPGPAHAPRYADLDAAGADHLVCVRELHGGAGEPAGALVRVARTGGPVDVVHEGRDFYACPRVSPDGRRLAWVAWDHPYMPWDVCEAWVGDLDVRGKISNARRVAGGEGEAAIRVDWSPDGVLHVVSDRSGFWNLYRVEAGELRALAAIDAEMGHPPWTFDVSTFAFLDARRIVCAVQNDGIWHLGLIESGREEVRILDMPYTDIGRSPRVVSDRAGNLIFVGGSPTRAREVVRGRIMRDDVLRCEVLQSGPELGIPADVLSGPEPIRFPAPGGGESHAFFYPPTNGDLEGLEEEKPPLIVQAHGGPTSCAQTALSLDVQFWTSRGFAVVDVNYGGSSGYGRAYRERLRGAWGIADVGDCIAAAEWLVREGRADGERLAIRGGSAGGFITLSALVFHDTFAAGSSRCGVGDIEALAAETHKFESSYDTFLVGPLPGARKLYRERSPIHSADRVACPAILIQGLEDVVVPPAQSEAFVAALDRKRLPHAYVTFPDEGHSFRKAPNIVRMLEAELAFFAHVFRFTPADELPPLDIRHPLA